MALQMINMQPAMNVNEKQFPSRRQLVERQNCAPISAAAAEKHATELSRREWRKFHGQSRHDSTEFQ